MIRERGLNPAQADVAYEAIAKMAARRASRFSDAGSEVELISLASRLLACQNPLSDPRGRPTLIEMTRADLEKKFGR